MSTDRLSSVRGDARLISVPAIWLLLACHDTVLVPIRMGDAGLAGDPREVGCDGGPDASCTCAESTAPTCAPSRCVAGMYEGSWKGSATPSVGGVPGLFTGLSDPDHHVMIRFSLRLLDADGTRRRGDGCIHSTDIVAGVPLVENSIAELAAEVDCESGEITAEGRGAYWSPSATGFGPYYYKCWLSATFDPETQSFVNGSFEMREPQPLVGEAGASGTWEAQRLPDETVPLSEECLEEPFPEELF